MSYLNPPQKTKAATGLPPSDLTPLGPHRPRDLRDLFWSLTVLALQGFGGVIAIAQRELVVRKQWYTASQFVEAWAVAQIMPGPNIVNLCADLGARYFGVRGILVAIAGLLTVPFVITIALLLVYTSYEHISWVAGIVRGMAAVSAGLVMAAGLRLAATLPQHPLGYVSAIVLALAAFVMVGVLRWNLAAVLLLLGGGACLLTYRALRQQLSSQVQS